MSICSGERDRQKDRERCPYAKEANILPIKEVWEWESNKEANRDEERKKEKEREKSGREKEKEREKEWAREREKEREIERERERERENSVCGYIKWLDLFRVRLVKWRWSGTIENCLFVCCLLKTEVDNKNL